MQDPKIKCLKRLAVEIQARVKVAKAQPVVLQSMSTYILAYEQMLMHRHWLGVRIDRGEPDREPVPKPEMRTMLRPIGDIVVWTDTQGDELLMVFIRDVLSGLIAGCSVTLTLIGGDDYDHEVLYLLQKSWKVAGWQENAFQVSIQDNLEAFKGDAGYLSCQALVFDFVDRKRGEAAKRVVGQWDKVIPCFENRRAANLSLFLPWIPQGELMELLKQTIGYLDGSNPGIFHRGALILCPDQVIDDWLDTVSERLENWNIEVKNAKDIREDFQNEKITPGNLQGHLYLVPYSNLEDCIELVRYLPETRPIQVFGTGTAKQPTERLIDEVELKASLLSLGCFPRCEDLFFLPAIAFPSCGDLELNEQVAEMLLVSRFMRPVCFQQVPDEYLPRELMRSKKS